MKIALFIVAVFLLSSCTMTSPERYFDIAVLNSNTISQFGGKEIYDWLRTQPQTYDEKSKQMVTSSYVDYVKFKFSYAEKALRDIEALTVTEDTKPMIEASRDLFSYAVDKERSGYVSIAAMKDHHASDEEIKAAAIDFNKQFQAEFGQKYDKMIEIGKAYAGKHNIKADFH